MPDDRKGYVAFCCPACSWEGDRYSNVKRCPKCGGRLERKAPTCCPTCRRPYNMALPRRFCSLCGKQITRHHKWCIGADGRIRHRNCADPTVYPPRQEAGQS